MRRIELRRFSNGLRVVLVDTPGLSSACIEVFLKIGSMYEHKDEAGMSHFIEHMVFKGSSRFPKAVKLFEELDSAGVSYNAGTGLESTSYYIRCVPEQLVWASSVLADLVFNPLFLQEEIEKERGVILEEIAMYNDTPSAGMAGDFAQKILKSGELGCWNVIGNKQTLDLVNSESMFKFYKKYFSPKRTVVAIAVDFGKLDDLELFIGEIEKHWQGVNPEAIELPGVEVEFDKFNLEIKREVDQSHFCLGVPMLGRNSSDKYLQKLTELMLCSNFSSKLVYLLREEMGVAYYVQPSGEVTKDFGYFAVQAGVNSRKEEEVVMRVGRTMVDIASWATPEALERMKRYLSGMTQQLSDKVTFWTDFIGQELLLQDKIANLDEELVEYGNVNLEALTSFASKYIKKENFSILKLKG